MNEVWYSVLCPACMGRGRWTEREKTTLRGPLGVVLFRESRRTCAACDGLGRLRGQLTRSLLLLAAEQRRSWGREGPLLFEN